MRETHYVVPATVTFPAAIELLTGKSPGPGKRCRIHHREGYVDAWTWLDLGAPGDSRVLAGAATTMEISCHGTDYVLLGFVHEADQPLTCILADELCPVPGVVRQTAMLVDSLKTPAMRKFVRHALLLPGALAGFWQRPASRRDHHAYPGGLAEHSLEVATMAASVSGLPQADRELGIAFGLLHDFGKVWCYGQDRTSNADPRNHEAIGRTRLCEGLRILADDDQHLAALMDELLGGPRVPRDKPYPLAIGRIIRSFDQMSCEKTRRPEAASRRTSVLRTNGSRASSRSR